MMANAQTIDLVPKVQPVDPRLGLVADAYNRHPGEQVRFTARLEPAAGWFSIALPAGLELLEYAPMSADWIAAVSVRGEEDGTVVDWQIVPGWPEGTPLEFTALANVLPHERDVRLMVQGSLRDGQGFEQAGEYACVTIKTRSAYLKYLPEIYQGNDFMARFLMVFESFWKPIENQIAHGEQYYDIDLAPANFLPWLASWIGVAWDETLSEERRRAMLHEALSMYQRRGTRQALEEFLRLYTGGEVEIVEHRAQNLVLGRDNKLGSTSALGTHNFPHTFTVMLRIQRAELQAIYGPEQVNAEKLYRKNIETIIEAQKPAHTAFGLNFQIIDSGPSAQVH